MPVLLENLLTISSLSPQWSPIQPLLVCICTLGVDRSPRVWLGGTMRKKALFSFLPTRFLMTGGLVTMTWWGAWLGLIWGGLVRIFITHHITWSINSVCHVFGRRQYDVADRSTNNLLCGLLGMGEGWHNNHHAFPTSARHGLDWWQIDASWLVIKAMQLVGLAWNVRLPSQRAKDACRINAD